MQSIPLYSGEGWVYIHFSSGFDDRLVINKIKEVSKAQAGIVLNKEPKDYEKAVTLQIILT